MIAILFYFYFNRLLNNTIFVSYFVFLPELYYFNLTSPHTTSRRQVVKMRAFSVCISAKSPHYNTNIGQVEVVKKYGLPYFKMGLTINVISIVIVCIRFHFIFYFLLSTKLFL